MKQHLITTQENAELVRIHWSDRFASSPHGHTADQLFQDCPKKFYYTYVRHLQPLPSIPLVVGSAIHAALAVYHGNAAPTWTEERVPGLTGRAAAALNEAFAYLYDSEHTAHLTEDQRTDVDFFVFRTLRAYCHTYAEPDPWITIGIEQAFDLELFPGIRSTGRIDGLISLNGQHLVLEHKTSSYSPERFYTEFANDVQVTRYCQAASMLLGAPVHGVLLNVLQKPAKRGLGQPHFQRYVMVRTPQQIEALREDLRVLRGWRDDADDAQTWPKNTSTCHDYFTTCSYHSLCFGAGETEENLSVYTKEEDR